MSSNALHSACIIICTLWVVFLNNKLTEAKYIEGELNTWENWAFLARFCFLSEAGQFEYFIEYEEDQGTPNLLLYYDEQDQWPSVYKSNKNCQQREGVLHAEQNQIVNLSTRYPYREAAGCQAPPKVTTQTPKYTLLVPTGKTTKQIKTTTSASGETATKTIVTTRVTISLNDLTAPSEIENVDTTIQRASESNEYFEISEAVTNPASSDFTTPTFTQTNSLVDRSSSDETTVTIPTSLSLKNDELTRINNEFVGTTQFYGTDVVSNDDEEEKPIRKRAILPKPTSKKVIRTVTCRNARRFRTARERWWFIAVSNCKGTRGIHIRYRMLMTNGDPGDYWHEHFSADEFYVLPVLMAFSVAYSFLILAIVICSIELKSRQLLHSTYKLFVFSAIVQFVGIIFKSMCYLKYAVNGVGTPSLKVVGSMFMGMSETCYLLLVLLLAKGYTVTRGRLPLSAGVKVTIFMCLYVVTYASLFIYEAKVFDPGEVLYTYESPAGYGLIILRVVAWCMFIYSTIFTLKHYPEKANFYYPFNVFGTLWFIAGPAFIISANTYIDKWVRESVVCAVLLFITFGGHLMFLLLTMPSVANKNFPYHVRTTQIGVMENCGDIGNNSIEQFNHHAYEPTTNGIDQTVIIPLSRRTEDIFSGMYSQQMITSTSASRRHALTNEEAPNFYNSNQPSEERIENVLNWSMAKNFNALDPPRMDRRQSVEILGARRLSDLPPVRPPPGVEENHSALQEWIREVPVELFTVSKTVVSKTVIEAPPTSGGSSSDGKTSPSNHHN